MGRQGWKGEHGRHSSAATRGWKKRRRNQSRLRTLIGIPRLTPRFNQYGDAVDGSGRHVSEYENSELNNDELVLKYNAAHEAHDMDQLQIIGRELEERGVFGQPND